MIRDVIALAKEHWPVWFLGELPEELAGSILGGGSSHTDRFIVFVHRGRAEPQVAMKVASTALDADRLRNEYTALSRVRPLLDAELQKTIPEPLGVYDSGDFTVLATGVLRGKGVLVPALAGSGSVPARLVMRQLFRQTFEWSRNLAHATRRVTPSGPSELAQLVEGFIATLPHEPSLRNVRAFQKAVSESRMTWFAAWQHRDLAVGNVLRYRGNLRVVDWEHASPESEPWYDIASAPGRMCHLALTQLGLSSMKDAALRVLPTDTWHGRILSNEMDSVWAYDVPLGWAVALSAMSVAKRHHDEGRQEPSPWGEFAIALLDDDELRSRASWLVPS